MIGIISDIHGNHTALQAVLNKLEHMGITKIICLGDIGGYYSQVNECCEELQARRIFSLMGNHDWYLAANEDCPRSNSANTCLQYQRKIITDSNRSWLASLKPQAEVEGISIVHGGWNDPLDEYVVPSLDYFSRFEGSLFSSGHTHVPCTWSKAGRTYCNPGSVGQPRDGNPRASFAVFKDGAFTLHRVAYDYRHVQEEMRAAGFEAYFYENLEFGTRIGGRVDKLPEQFE